jgi:F-box domain
MTTTLFDLPAEVIILTLRHLPLRELVACKRSCRRLYALIEHSQLLQYHFRAMCSGVEDLFVPGVSSSEFLKSLEDWETAWWKFDIGDRFARHRYHNVLWTVEHIVQNGYIAAMRLGDSSWHTAPGWSYADISNVSLQGDEVSQRSSWKDIQLDRAITPKGYVLDVNQDLVAVVFWSVSTRSRFRYANVLSLTVVMQIGDKCRFGSYVSPRAFATIWPPTSFPSWN